MNLVSIFRQFPDQQACIAHLEQVRWGDHPSCPHCAGYDVARKRENQRIGRWNCHSCKSSFNVLSGTVMQKTKVPLQKWFLAITLMQNAKKSLSSLQLARDLELNKATAWYLAMRIRRAMAEADAEADFLRGIVEADETYVGGRGKRDSDGNPPKRGRGTSKTPVLGAVERGGDVVARPSDRVDGVTIAEFIADNVDFDARLMTDQFPSYRAIGREKAQHGVVDHSKYYVNGIFHTNTIEGFWSLVKRAWYGSHHHYSRRWQGEYIAEACYKYNIRHAVNPFADLLESAVCVIGGGGGFWR
jgi:transposase-like protein